MFWVLQSSVSLPETKAQTPLDENAVAGQSGCRARADPTVRKSTEADSRRWGVLGGQKLKGRLLSAALFYV
jgi:hypothetical protein